MAMDNPHGGINLVGGRLCLDFVNTVDTHDTLIDEKLRAYADLVWWGLRAGAVDEPLATVLLARGQAHPDEAAAVLARAMALREAMFRALVAAPDGGEVDGADLDVLNGELGRALSRLRVLPGGDGLEYGWADGPGLDRVLWPVVRDAAELLVSGELRRVGKCGGHDCDWMYLDTSRNRSRRWCDMQVCGNRAKVRRHYQRAKGSA